MDHQYHLYLSEEERAANRARRAADRKKKKQLQHRQYLRQAFPLICLVLVLSSTVIVWMRSHPAQAETSVPPSAALSTAVTVAKPEKPTQAEPETDVSPEPQAEPAPVQKPEAETVPAPETAVESISTEAPKTESVQEAAPMVPPASESEPEPSHDPKDQPISSADRAKSLIENTYSSYVLLMDLQSDEIIVEKASSTVISPASMTKILTLMVAVENAANLDDTVIMTQEIFDYCYVNGCSIMGLAVGQTVSIRELLYGCILPSGADACLLLAEYVAGSHEAFVDLMNKKLDQLGLSETAHFTNCIGLYHEAHGCTVYDIAMILKAAMNNDQCREVLTARTYQTAPSAAFPEGQLLSNWFIRRIEDHDTGGIKVIAAKTGYVEKAGNCAASCGQDSNGNLYICVTGNANSPWRVIYDHRDLYKTYCN